MVVPDGLCFNLIVFRGPTRPDGWWRSALMHKTQAWLADGRECTFYARRLMQRDIPADRRSLPPRPDAAELRFDVRSGRWVVIAGHRQGRSFRPGAAECPLCPSRGSAATEIPAADYEVVVFDNRFPA